MLFFYGPPGSGKTTLLRILMGGKIPKDYNPSRISEVSLYGNKIIYVIPGQKEYRGKIEEVIRNNNLEKYVLFLVLLYKGVKKDLISNIEEWLEKSRETFGRYPNYIIIMGRDLMSRQDMEDITKELEKIKREYKLIEYYIFTKEEPEEIREVFKRISTREKSLPGSFNELIT